VAAGQTLTNLKDSNYTQTPRAYQPTTNTSEETRLAELRSEITLSTKIRDDLKLDIEKLTRDIAKSKETAKTDTEVKRLKLQKVKLLKEITKLTDTFYKTQKHQDIVSKGLNKYGDDHIAFLTSLSKSLQLDTVDITKDLSKRSKKLKEEEDFLTQLSEYMGEYTQNVEATTSQNALERTELDTKVQFIKKKEDLLEVNIKTANDLLKKAKEEHKTAVKELNEGRKYRLIHENAYNEIQTDIRTKQKELNLQKKEIKAERQGLKDKSKQLDEKLRLIKDRDQALNRKARELKIMV